MNIFKDEIIEIMSFFKGIEDEKGDISISMGKVLSYDFVNSKEGAVEIMSEIVSQGLLKDIPNKRGEAWLLTDIGRKFVRTI